MVVVVQPKVGTVTRWRRTYEVENDHHHQRTTLIALVLVGLGGGVAPSMRGPADLHGEGWGENYSTSAGGGAVRGNVRHEHRTAPLRARSSGQPRPARLASVRGSPL